MIRLLESTEHEAVLDIWEAASRQAHPFLDDVFLKEERAEIAEVHMPHATTWVYEQDGKVLGFVAMVDDEIGGLFVDPARQRQGIGRALVDHVRERHDTLELEVFEANHIGRAFYASYGFEEIGSVRHEKTGRPMLRLRLPKDAR